MMRKGIHYRPGDYVKMGRTHAGLTDQTFTIQLKRLTEKRFIQLNQMEQKVPGDGQKKIHDSNQ